MFPEFLTNICSKVKWQLYKPKAGVWAATAQPSDAGEMLNYLLNKTYPNRFQGRGRQKSASPTRRDAFSNGNKQKELQNYRSAWTNMKNNSSKDKPSK